LLRRRRGQTIRDDHKKQLAALLDTLADLNA
jgi:hypothetical protein